MKSRGISHATLMLLVCALPLLVFFALALVGVPLNPLWVPLIMILCCLAMFYLTAGACGHAHTEPIPEVIPAEPTMPSAETLKTDDVFRVHHSRQVGAAVVQEGELLRDPDEAYAVLKARSENAGATPLLQEGRDGRPLLVWLPEAADGGARKERSPWLNVLLLLLTLLTTTWAGAAHAGVDLLQEPGRLLTGFPYSLALLLILGAHELGHYFAARAHHMRVTLPYFIPVPFGLGTFGAFIQLKSPAENRRALFDVGVAGPLAGVVFAIPALWIGLRYSRVLVPGELADHMHGGIGVGSSALLALISNLALGDALAEGHRLLLHPLAFAGWLGLLVTALNLLPIGQLDGGHIADAMFGRARSAAIGRAALFALVFLGLFVWSGLLTWALIVYFIAGGKGLPPLNDVSRMGSGRLAIGAFAFVLLFLILAPVPHALYDALGIHCPYL
jgi:membrane-associated protease RseP (regulator of RpoE activity)